LINPLNNAKNPYQGKAKRVLCVCSAGLLRSPTTAVVLAKEYGFNTRACGVDHEYALIPVSPTLLYWADEIVCMDGRQRHELERQIDKFNKKNVYMAPIVTDVHVLEVPDMYAYMDSDLQSMILNQYHKVVNNG